MGDPDARERCPRAAGDGQEAAVRMKPYLVETESRLREFFVLEAPDEQAARQRVEAAGPEALSAFRVGAQWSEAWEIVSVQAAPPEALGKHYPSKEERLLARILRLSQENRYLRALLAAARARLGEPAFDAILQEIGAGPPQGGP